MGNQHMSRVGHLITSAVLLVSASAQQPTTGPADFFQLLRTRIGVSERDLSATLPAGQALAMVLPAREKSGIAVAGAERIRVPLDFFLNAFREMPVFKSGQKLLRVGEFSTPPRRQDLQSPILDPTEVEALSSCSPGQCSVKVSASMMEEVRDNALGTGSLDRLFRNLILQYVSQYLEKGNVAMITYADKLPAIPSSHEFYALLSEFDWLSEAAPPLYDCLKSFSGNSCPEIESLAYWSSAKFGFKPVFSITHMMIYRTVRAGQEWVFVAFKQIYADHYFDGSLGLAVLAEQSPGPANPALWVLYINRSRTDAFEGWLGSMKKAVAKRSSRGAVRNNLLRLKDNLERRYLLAAETFRR